MANSYDYERKTAQELKDILGWADGSHTDLLNEVLCVTMALCEKVKTLEHKISCLTTEGEG